jgi:hypothetical protein
LKPFLPSPKAFQLRITVPVAQEYFMPPDTSKNSSRRTFRKVTNEEDVELKRARGEISCAECRRSVFNFQDFFWAFLMLCIKTETEM